MLYLLDTISTLMSDGFFETVIILFLLKIFWKKAGPLWADLFRMSNSILLGASILALIAVLIHYLSAWYSQVPGEVDAFKTRITGPYWYSYWIIHWCPLLAPQIFWFRRFRKSATASLLMLVIINFGIVMERIVIFMTQRYRDARPAAWVFYEPSMLEVLIPFFSFSVVLAGCYFLNIRLQNQQQKRAGLQH